MAYVNPYLNEPASTASIAKLPSASATQQLTPMAQAVTQASTQSTWKPTDWDSLGTNGKASWLLGNANSITPETFNDVQTTINSTPGVRGAMDEIKSSAKTQGYQSMTPADQTAWLANYGRTSTPATTQVTPITQPSTPSTPTTQDSSLPLTDPTTLDPTNYSNVAQQIKGMQDVFAYTPKTFQAPDNSAWGGGSAFGGGVTLENAGFNEQVRQSDIANTQWDKTFAEEQSQNATVNSQWEKEFAAQQAQNKFENDIAEAGLTGVYNNMDTLQKQNFMKQWEQWDREYQILEDTTYWDNDNALDYDNGSNNNNTSSPKGTYNTATDSNGNTYVTSKNNADGTKTFYNYS